MKKRVLALLLSAVMVVGCFAGCGGSDNTQTGGDVPSTQEVEVEVQTEATSKDVVSAQVDVVNIASDRDPSNFGPWAGNMGGASAQIPLVYQSLQIMELNSEAEPCLAKTVTQIDELTYEVELFDYIHDSEGNHLTTSDIVFGVNTAKEIGKVNSVKVIDSIEVIDDYKFKVVFSDRAAMGDTTGFFCQTYFVTQAAYEAEGNGMAQHPIGTAQYKLREFISGSVISFEKDPNFWQTDEQYIARSSEAHADVVNFQIITEAAQRAIAVEGGTLDYGAVSVTDKDRLVSAGFDVVPIPDNLTYMMFANMDEASVLSGNKELRQALFYALSNEMIAQLYTTSDAVPVYDLSNSNYSDYYGDVYAAQDNYYQYDVEKAKELLAASGFDASQEITLICGSDQGSVEIAEILKTFWAEIGLTNITIESYQGNMMNDIAGDPANWDLYLLQYASTDYAVNVWEKVLNSAKYKWGGTINFVMDEELQSKLAAVRSPQGHTQENVVAFHDYVVDGAWAVGLIQGIQYYACSPKLDGDNIVFSEQRLIRPNATIYKED